DSVEEALTIRVRRQNALCIGAETAEQVVELGVFGSEELLQLLFQGAGKGGRLAAGRNRELNRSSLDDRRHDEFAKVRDVDDVHRNLAPPAVARDPAVDAFVAG